MKSPFELVLDPESVERRGRSPAVGAVHVEFQGEAFPEAGWSDFALEFLKAYWEAVLELGKRADSTVSFYEGPYKLRFHRAGEEVAISALARDQVVHSGKLPYMELLEHSMRAILPWIEHEQAVGTG